MIHTESCTSLAESSFLSTAPGHQADDAGAHRHLYLDREGPSHMLSVSDRLVLIIFFWYDVNMSTTPIIILVGLLSLVVADYTSKIY